MPAWDIVFNGYDEKDVAYEISNGILNAFEWYKWNKGHSYWSDVYDSLRYISFTIKRPRNPATQVPVIWSTIYTNENVTTPEEKARVLADALWHGFAWRNTAEGSQFWNDIRTELNHLSPFIEKTKIEVEKVEEKVWWDKSLPKRID